MQSSPGAYPARSATSTVIPTGSARCRTTAMVWGWHRASTTNVERLPRWAPANIDMASAAAVPSSRSDALATGRPVRSLTTVWKFRSASSRPWAISAWYGVYWVYQPGFSSTFRWMTGGSTVPE